MALFPLNIIVEILINGTWRDISRYVYQRDTLTITGGRTDNGDTSQPAQVTITLNNRDGRFSPGYASGAFFPYLKQNTQLRISVNDTSSSGNVYNGFRFWGEVPEWPPLSDISGNDVYVQIIANGPLRRIRNGGGEGSALARYYASLTGLYAPIGYWPCEEDENTELIGPGVQGGSSMTVVSGAPKWKAVSDFNGSAPIGVVNGSTWTGITSSFGSSGDDIFLNPGTYPWIASTATVDTRVWGAGGGGSKGSEGNSGGSGGGGGAYARNSAVVVTPGQQYFVTVGTGGQPDNWSTGGDDGTDSSFTGDAVTVTGHAGKGSAANGASGGAGGTTSGAATANFAGGAGGGSATFNQGGGGGSSAGTAAAGNNGSNASFGSFGAGGNAVTGGGQGGDGGGFSPQRDGKDGSSPGGGGGGGWANNSSHTFGGAGASGKVELIYTASGGGTKPSNNVVRFICFVPKHTGNNNKVMVRALGSGTIARLDVIYGTGGQMKLQGYSSAPALLFDSGFQTFGADGQTLMVSAELAVSGADVKWAFSAIRPGDDGVVAKGSGTVTTATMGSVSQVIVAPNGDITKTAIGHISVQYALIPLWKVSRALHGHHTESGIDRFIRLAKEQAMGHLEEYNEGSDHWGFEAGTQSWVAVNGALTNPTTTFTDTGGDTWPTVGTHSLLLTCNGSANPSAQSPAGTSAQPCLPGDVVSVSADVYNPVQINNVFIGLRFYNAAGTFLSESDQTDYNLPVNEIHSRRISGALGQAPPSTAFVAVIIGCHSTPANTTKLYIDHVHIHPAMGPQTRKQYKDFLEEIQDLDQGLMKEAKELWGMKYRTRIRLINQAAAVTLDYAQGMISPPLAPVVDTRNLKNDITVHRHKGSKVQVTLNAGGMSIIEPSGGGSGRFKKRLKAVAAADEQLAALAAHLLLVGTSSDERYPTITVNLARAGITGNALAPLMSAVAGVEIGDLVQINNLPFWYPSTTAKQMVVGYTETLNAYEWTCTFNCVPYTPYIQVTTSLRRW
jgi:hypothetical protein